MESESVDGTEVTLDPAEFLLKEHVVETGIEFTITNSRSCYILGILTTTEKNMFGMGARDSKLFLIKSKVYLMAAELTGAFDL